MGIDIRAFLFAFGFVVCVGGMVAVLASLFFRILMSQRAYKSTNRKGLLLFFVGMAILVIDLGCAGPAGFLFC